MTAPALDVSRSAAPDAAPWGAKAADASSHVALGVGALLWVASWLGLDPTNVPQRMDFQSFHFPSVLAFARRPLDEAIVDYPAAPFPLFYALGAVVYRLTDSVLSLRVFTVVLGLGVLFCAARLARGNGAGVARWTVAAVLVSPYFRGQTVYANTDVLAMLFAAGALVAFGQESPRFPSVRGLAAFALACGAVYTRQFYVFLPAALLVRTAVERPRRETALVVAYCTVLALPLLALVALWRGVTPPGFRQHAALSFVDSVPVVILLLAFYLTPLLAVTAWRFRDELARDLRRPAFLAVAVPCGVFAAYLAVAQHRPPEVVGGGLPMHVIQALPIGAAGQSTLLAAGVAVGGASVAYLFQQNPARNALLLFIALCFAPTSILYQRYFDPLLPLVALTALSTREASSRHLRSASVLAFALELAVTAIGAVHYRHVFGGT